MGRIFFARDACCLFTLYVGWPGIDAQVHCPLISKSIGEQAHACFLQGPGRTIDDMDGSNICVLAFAFEEEQGDSHMSIPGEQSSSSQGCASSTPHHELMQQILQQVEHPHQLHLGIGLRVSGLVVFVAGFPFNPPSLKNPIIT